MPLPKRKSTRLPGYDYSSSGLYFITACTLNRQKILCKITPTTGNPALDPPTVTMTKYGHIVQKHLESFRDFYPDIKILSYVIMPNHIHIMFHIPAASDGPPRASAPTQSKVGQTLGTIKRFCNKEIGFNIWQRGSYDQIITCEEHFVLAMEYIDANPSTWLEDKYYNCK